MSVVRTVSKTTATALVVLSLFLGQDGVARGQATAAPRTQPPASEKAATKAAAARLDLNKATAEQMVEALPGVGEVTARKIIAGRPYASVDDLAKAGVSARTIEAIRPMVVVAPAAATPKPAAPKAVTPREPMPMPRTPAAGAKKLNVNTATPAELQTLPGIGPVAAAAIVAGRPYRSVNDLERVRGLGEAKVAALRDLVSVSDPVPPAATPTAPGAPKSKVAAKTATPKTPGRGGLMPGQVVNINTAPKEVLDLLPGIGPVKAQAIIDGRPFKTKEDVMKVKGIKEGEFSRIRDLIRVD